MSEPKKSEKNKVKREYFRSGISRGIKDGVDGIDRENNVIRGFSVISLGEAIGHGLEIDSITLDQVYKLGVASKNGIKSRFGHPNMSGTAMGTFLGRVKNFKKNDDRVVADLFIDETAFNTPNGDLGSYVLDLAESDPDAFGASIVFPTGDEIENNENGLKDSDGELLKLARLSQLNGVDVVDDPATGDGFFSQIFNNTTVQLSSEMTVALDDFFSQDNAFEKATSFLDKYIANEEYRNVLKERARKVIDMKKEKKEKIEEPNKIKFQFEEDDMPIPKDASTDTTQKQFEFTAASVAEREELAKDQERKRIAEITASCGELKLDSEFSKKLITDGTPIEDARKMMLEKAKEKMKSVDTTVEVTKDGQEKLRNGMANAILVRSNLEKDPKVIGEVNKSQFRSLSLQNLAKHCLMNDGVSDAYMMDGNQLYQSLIGNNYFASAPTQGSGDFVNVLSNVLNKSVNLGWNTASSTFEFWVGTGQLSDFKTADLVRMTPYGDLKRIREGEAPGMANMTDTKEQTRLQTYGSKYIISRQAMVNDDLSQLTTIPQKQMRSLRRLMNKLCYNLIYDNNGAGTAFLGPTMLEDSITMFNTATHNNLVTTGSGAVTQAALDTAFVAMKNQTALSPDADRSDPIYLNIGPEYLICGPQNELAAYKLFNNIGYNVSTDDSAAEGTVAANIHGPGQPRNLKLIVDAELDNISSSYYPWYLATNPNDVGHITLYTLNGQTTPFTEAAANPTGDARGMTWVIEHDFRFAQTDWRGMYCNRGAAV